MFAFCSICSLSLGPWADYTLFGKTIFDLLDYFTSNILLPIVAIGVCLYVGYVLPRSFFFNETNNGGTVRFRLAPMFYWFIRVVAPLLLLAVFVNKLFFD